MSLPYAISKKKKNKGRQFIKYFKAIFLYNPYGNVTDRYILLIDQTGWTDGTDGWTVEFRLQCGNFYLHAYVYYS